MAHHDLNLNTDISILEYLSYHNVNRSGYVVLMTKQAGERLKSTAVRLKDLPQAIDKLDMAGDIFISQCAFGRPNRQSCNLKHISHLFIDLDTYGVPRLQGLSAERLAQVLLQECDDLLIPPPSSIVASGRGIQAKWIFDVPLLAVALPRWKLAQQELCRRLAHLGADANALDASRVLRLVGSTNTKNGERVRLVHAANVPTFGASRLKNGLLGYSFDLLCDVLLPVSRAELAERVAQPNEGAGGHIARVRMPKKLKKGARTSSKSSKTARSRSVIDRHIPATPDRHLPATRARAEGRLARPFCGVYFAVFSVLF